MQPTRKVLQTAPFAVAIMGNPITSDFELVDLSPGSSSVTDEQLTRFRMRGMRFLGFAGIQGGMPQTSLEEPLDGDAVETLSQAYLLHIQSALNKRLTGA